MTGREEHGILGSHPAVHEVLEAVRRVARLSTPVLLEGATGTGKELAARAIHRASARPGRFVGVNVAVLAEAVAESELFGSVRGSFTGATDRSGLIEAARDGTLYLDECADLAPALQAKLLRVLDTGVVRRVGAANPRPVNFRLVVSVQVPPETLVAEGRWRADFYFRVAGIPIRLPRLAERSSDIPALASRFLAATGRSPVSPAVFRVLLAHPWPGNVRELQRVIERAVFLASDAPVGEEHLLRALGAPAERPAPGAPEPGLCTLADVERRHIARVLGEVESVRVAAGILGLSVAQLYRKLHRLDLEVPGRLGGRFAVRVAAARPVTTVGGPSGNRPA